MTTHGKSDTRIYRIWVDMKNRCNSTTNHAYDRYGGRGISVCDEWNTFEPFYEWAISTGYTDDLTIDRIDVNGDYTPSNCKWSTYIEQNNNQRSTHYLEYNGEIHSITEWSRVKGIPRTTIRNRLRRGWPIESVLTVPVEEKYRHKNK